jgi:hypothetical protein
VILGYRYVTPPESPKIGLYRFVKSFGIKPLLTGSCLHGISQPYADPDEAWRISHQSALRHIGIKYISRWYKKLCPEPVEGTKMTI